MGTYQARKLDIERRAETTTKDFMPVCTVPDFRTGKRCGRPTMRAARLGLARFHCRYHVEHKARHGSHWHPSYRASELKPYLGAAAEWIENNRNDFWVDVALTSLSSAMQMAGPAEIATRLRGLSPRKRARAALARLREAAVTPERLLAIHLAVSALIEEDPGSHRIQEFRIVQIAKAIHRLASGYHQKWDVPLPDGQTIRKEIHAYPRSSGRVLRHLGAMIEDECELVADRHLYAVLALKVERYGTHPAIKKPTGHDAPQDRGKPLT